MALLGSSALVLSFDIAPDMINEHDEWHTHEHVPERLALPGFLRGSRWVAQQGRPKYFVMYEVEALAALTSAAYLERLNNPTPWTAKMMPHYRGMTRGLCTIAGSFGLGLGQTGLLVHFEPAPGKATELRRWLLEAELPRLPAQAGLASAHLLEGAVEAPSTTEQRIRGSDATVNLTVLVTGYDTESVVRLFESTFTEDQLARRGATGCLGGVYRMAYSLVAQELSTPDPSSACR